MMFWEPFRVWLNTPKKLQIIVYFATGEEKSILANVRFVARAESECDNTHSSFLTSSDKGEKDIFFSPSKCGKVRFHNAGLKDVLFRP